jgi:hypothetical protein
MTLRTYAHAVEAADAPIALTLSHVLDFTDSMNLEVNETLSDEIIDGRYGDEDTPT